MRSMSSYKKGGFTGRLSVGLKKFLNSYLVKFFLFFLISNIYMCPRMEAVCCPTINSKLDHEVIPEVQSIESKLDHWIGPLTESIHSKIDTINLSFDCCRTVISTLDQVVIPEVQSIESKLDHWVGPVTETIDSMVDVIDTKLNENTDACCTELKRLILTKGTIITNGTNTITADGVYTATANIQACITIDADNVIIDLCGFTLTCTSADAVIEILPGHNNIEIINGKLKGASDLTNDGILTGSACELVLIENIKTFSCDNGLNFAGTESDPIKDCKIIDCVFKACNRGAVLDYSCKMVFKNCQALNCVKAGFKLTGCQFNLFENCEALQTSSDEAEDVVGFSSKGGTGNLFKECVAEGTSKSVSELCRSAVGFLLTGSEIESKIIGCVANSTNVLTGSGSAYGILLEQVVTGTDLTDELISSYTHGDDVRSVDWSTSGTYLAIGGDNGTGGYEVRVLSFDGSSLSLIDSYTHSHRVTSVAWSPSGQYLAIGSFNVVGGYEVRVFQFNGSSLTTLSGANYDNGVNVYSVSWSPSGQYLAMAGDVAADNKAFRIFQFNGTTLSAPINHPGLAGSAFNSVDWSSCGRYLAIGAAGGSVAIFEFDGASITNPGGGGLVYYDHGAAVYSVNWSSCGTYLAMGGQKGTGDYEVRVLVFDASSSSLTEVANYASGSAITALSVSWSPREKYLSIGGNDGTGTYELRILEFDGSSLAEVTGYDHGDNVLGVDWEGSGQYLAMGGSPGTGGYEVRVFEVMYAPDNCLIENNRVCNTTSGSSSSVGVSGDGSLNLFARNVAYGNDTNFSSGITNVYTGDLPTYDTLDNISAPYTPVPSRCCQTVNSKIDVAVIPELLSIDSKLDVEVIPQLRSIESKLDVVVIPQVISIE
ncbi:WD40 repeat domain-containing protein, partial [Candidatus Dependentiae bacterium]